jgi:hypothetical protein
MLARAVRNQVQPNGTELTVMPSISVNDFSVTRVNDCRIAFCAASCRSSSKKTSNREISSAHECFRANIPVTLHCRRQWTSVLVEEDEETDDDWWETTSPPRERFETD